MSDAVSGASPFQVPRRGHHHVLRIGRGRRRGCGGVGVASSVVHKQTRVFAAGLRSTTHNRGPTTRGVLPLYIFFASSENSCEMLFLVWMRWMVSAMSGATDSCFS